MMLGGSQRCVRGIWDAGITLVVPGYPSSFTDSLKLLQSKVRIPGAGLSFVLFKHE